VCRNQRIHRHNPFRFPFRSPSCRPAPLHPSSGSASECRLVELAPRKCAQYRAPPCAQRRLRRRSRAAAATRRVVTRRAVEGSQFYRWQRQPVREVVARRVAVCRLFFSALRVAAYARRALSVAHAVTKSHARKSACLSAKEFCVRRGERATSRVPVEFPHRSHAAAQPAARTLRVTTHMRKAHALREHYRATTQQFGEASIIPQPNAQKRP